MKKFAQILAVLFLPLIASAQLSRSADVKQNRAFVYTGKLVRPDGSTPNGNVGVSLKIYSPDPSLCLLWAENQTVEVKQGGFSVELGHAVNRASGAAGGAAADFKQVFVNNAGLVIGSAQCASGTSYTPTAVDDRLLVAAFNDGGTVVEIAGLPIKSVPYALQAEEIGGYGLSNLAKISGSGSAVTYSPAEIQSLKDLLGGDVNWDMKSRKITKLADPVANDDAATKGWVASQISASGGGTVTNVNGSAPITVTSGTSTPVISMPAATNAADGYLTAVDHAVFAAKLAAVAGHTLPSGQVWIGNGSNQAAAGNFGIGQMRNNIGTLQFPTSCSASQTLTWSAVTDVLSCTNIALSAAAVSGLGGLADNNSVDLSGAEATGTLAAGRFPALTGAVTTTAGSLATTLANNSVATAHLNDKAVTFAKIQDLTSGRLLGRATAGTGATEEIQLGSGLSFTGTTLNTIANGTVTSVGVTVPAYMSAGSAITNSGTIALGFNNQAQNAIFAGPATGGTGAVAFRAMDPADVPSLNTSKLTAGTLALARGGTGVSPAGVIGDANKVFGLDAAGAAGEMKTLNQGTGISISQGVGTITIATTGTLSSTLPSGQIFVGNGSSVATAVAPGGQVTMDNAGAFTIANNAINSARISDGTVGVADLDFAGAMATNTGLVVRNGTQFYNKTCSGNEALIFTVANGWICSAIVLTEADPKVGANTTNYASKWNGSALVASTIYESGGSVGIGTTSPNHRLQVSGGVNNSLFTTTDWIQPSTGSALKIGLGAATGNTYVNLQALTDGASGVGNLVLNGGGGNVGVGTASPATALEINGTATVQASVEAAAASVSSTAAYSVPDIAKNIRRITLTANATITLPATTGLAADMAYSLTVRVKQDATGSRTLAWASGANSIKWDSGSAPAVASSANTETIYQFLIIGGEAVWYGSQVWKEN